MCPSHITGCKYAGLYLYHNLPILQINNCISYQIGRTDTDIHGWLDIIVLSINFRIPYLVPGQVCACACLPFTCKTGLVETWAFCGVANRSSAVWRYFSITDEGKAICKIIYANKQYLLVDKKGKTTKRSSGSHTRGAGDIADNKEKQTPGCEG